MKNIVRVTGTQTISSETTFASDLLVDTMRVDGAVSISGYLNDHNVTVLAADTLLKLGKVFNNFWQ